MKITECITVDQVDKCPVHGAALKAEYIFGQSEANLWKGACGCCAVDAADGLAAADYYPDFATAAGHARLIVATGRDRGRGL